MKIFWAYIGSRRLGFILFGAFFALVGAVAYLYGLPMAAVGYAVCLCAFVGAVLCAIDGLRYARRHKTLAALTARAALSADRLPEPGDLLERDYQELVLALSRENARQASESGRRFRDMTDYYTLWAHQIKTPIAAMELMLQQEEQPDRQELRQQLFRVEQYVEMALGYLRLDSESSDFVLGRYDLDGIVRAAVRKYAAQFIRRKLRLDYRPLRTVVLTDEKWLQFVVEQLLSNALKYTPEGGVSIYMEPEKTLVIRDTGIGIQPSDLPRIFEKGFTGFNGRTDRKSTGIGLYLTRRVCGRLGHDIAIDSQVGVGTAVRLRLESVELETE